MPSEPQNAPLSILFDTWLISHLIGGLLDDVLQRSGMSGDDFGLYSLLRAFGPASPSQIARWTGLRATTVSAALKRLDARGHSVHERSQQDRRSYTVALSEAGTAAHARTAKVFWNETRALAAVIGPREPALRQALQTLDAALRESAGLDPRPYRLADAVKSTAWTLEYDGTPLTRGQELQARQYIDFLRTSDA